MDKLSRKTLYSLEDYAAMRDEFRRKVMAHKRPRRVSLDAEETANLYFEDFLTMQYQVQEMLRAERIFEAEGIEDELSSYNPLIPDGRNWKATFMLEFPDVSVRRARLAELIGIEDRVYVQVGDQDRVYAIADEDMERDTEEKTSSVHFMRFELTPEMAAAAKEGAAIKAGVEHPGLTTEVTLSEESRASLVADLD